MDLLTLIGMCSVAKDFTLVLAMAATFSHGNEFTIKDSVELANPPLFDPTYGAEMAEDDRAAQQPRSRTEALAKLKRLQAAGRMPLVGLLPIPPAWADSFRRRASELLNPCINISVGSAMIAKFEYQCGGKGGRECVLQRYAHAAGLEAFAERVLETIEASGAAEGTDVVLESDAVFSNPIYPNRREQRNWGADQIFFTTQRDQQERSASKRLAE